MAVVSIFIVYFSLLVLSRCSVVVFVGSCFVKDRKSGLVEKQVSKGSLRAKNDTLVRPSPIYACYYYRYCNNTTPEYEAADTR